MAKFIVTGTVGINLERYVVGGSWTNQRTVIEAACFYRAIASALYYEQDITFELGNELNSATKRVYSNQAHKFLVEKLD